MKKIRDIMTREVETVGPTSTVKHAAERMRHLDLGALPVCQDGHVLGVLTDREMTLHIAAEGRDSTTTLVRDIMDPRAAVLSEDDDVKAVERAMEEKGTHRVFVVDQDRKLVGIVSLGKVARADTEKAAGKVVKTISRSRTGTVG